MAQVNIILCLFLCWEVRKCFFLTEFSDAVSNVSEIVASVVKIMQKIGR